MKIFFDIKFTELSPRAKPISIGMVTENGDDEFYAEFVKWEWGMILPERTWKWLEENICPYLDNGKHYFQGTRDEVADKVYRWLYKYSNQFLKFWGSVLVYDWMLFVELFKGTKYSADYQENQILPSFIHPIPFSIDPLMEMKGVNTLMPRWMFAKYDRKERTALEDARIVKACYEKLVEK